jgi:hypothetical protein
LFGNEVTPILEMYRVKNIVLKLYPVWQVDSGFEVGIGPS